MSQEEKRVRNGLYLTIIIIIVKFIIIIINILIINAPSIISEIFVFRFLFCLRSNRLTVSPVKERLQ